MDHEDLLRFHDMKILFLSHKLPYPPISGGSIKRWKLVEYLAARHDLAIAALGPPEDLRWQAPLLSRIKVTSFYAESLSRARNAANLIRCYVRRVPLTVYRNYSPTFRKHVASIAPLYEVLFVDSYLMFQYVPPCFSGRVIVHEHNAEYLVWERYAKIEQNLLKRGLILLEARRIGTYLKVIGQKAHRILAAPNDIEALARLGIPRSRLEETLHLGNEALLNLPRLEFESTEEALLAVGTLDWEPNADGLAWFIEKVWAALKKEKPDLRFYIVGRHVGRRLPRLVADHKDIHLMGFVDAIEAYYAKSRVFVAPLRFGSGMKVKVIEAMYRGLPTVTTPIGAEGLEVVPGRDLGVAEEAAAMAREIRSLLDDRTKWEAFRDRSRELAARKYRWKRVFDGLEEHLMESSPRHRD